MRQHHHHQPPTLVAILGTHTLAEDILGRLLEHEGYDVRHLQAHPAERVEDLLDDVDILLLAAGLEGEVREGFLKAMKSTPKTAAIPVLPLSSALKMALLDEISAGAPWRGLFEELVGEIGAALQRAAASAGALVVEGSGADPPGPVPQADAAL